jgi:RNA polymerase sigma-70 factor (ECF subfamily)
MDAAAAFRSLFDANYSRVRALLVRIVGPQEAEDLTQVVFAKAAEALPGFRGQAQPSTWLYRIAANVGSDWLRSRAAQQAKVTVGLSGAEDRDTTEACTSLDRGHCQNSPEQELIRKEMNDCIRQVIGQLPENYRSVLVLGELAGLSDEEVAETLGISGSNAKVRLHRARAQLKQALNGRCDFYRNEENELACEPKPRACGSPNNSKSCAGAA